jgi:hypothetical protein
MCICRWVPTFPRNILSASAGLKIEVVRSYETFVSVLTYSTKKKRYQLHTILQVMKIEAVCSSETSVPTYKSIRRQTQKTSIDIFSYVRTLNLIQM